MHATINLPLVPLRESDNEQSEMLSQLLFGESVEIIETRERWLFVHNLTDNYKGWVDRKMVHFLTLSEEDRIAHEVKSIVKVPVLVCYKTTSNEKMYLPGGSILYTDNDGKCTIGNESLIFSPSNLESVGTITGQKLIETASQYLNAPYLWGGKSIMGIDCSGLVQVVFSMCGIQLQRNASEQAEKGEVIDNLSVSKTGDLAFFENSAGRIIHVGILLNSHQIIHASGWVKIENVDSQGIISRQTGDYTHKLKVIKRLI
jgi:hypothetical protein